VVAQKFIHSRKGLIFAHAAGLDSRFRFYGRLTSFPKEIAMGREKEEREEREWQQRERERRERPDGAPAPPIKPFDEDDS
jgi:hypothetical protein